MMHIAVAENEAFSAKFVHHDRPSVATIVCLKISIEIMNNNLSELKYGGEMKGLYQFKCCREKIFTKR